MPSVLCLVGTDTDAGKSFVTAALAKAAVSTQKNVLVLKPVQTGCSVGPDGTYTAPDIETCLRAAPGITARAIACFEPACSPHRAARLAGRELSVSSLAEAVRAEISASNADIVLIEGAGGLYTPLNERETMADLLALLDFPLLLVAGNKLGAVNHALLSLEACTRRGLRPAGFVTTEPTPAKDAEEQALRNDNAAIIEQLSGVPCLARVPHCTGAQAAKALHPVLEALCKQPEQDADALPDPLPDPLLDFDRAHIWHPYTSATNPLRAWEAVETRGTRIILRSGRELVDGMASWWCAIHGYKHPALTRALHSQAAKMPHVMFGGLTHAPAVSLAEKLLAIAPSGLEHVFFADSGSVAVEVALKMALQYQMATGKTDKKSVLALRGGYHGDTLGAMSVCDPENGMHHLLEGVLPRQIFAPRPECRPGCHFDALYDPASFAAFEATLSANAEKVAAVILEPIVQGAGGMWFYHPDFLRDVKQACERHACLLICDEIATGFGRTGRLFACEHAGVSPDILCVGKALSGGMMSLAATLATKDVARGISNDGGVLMHGPTFMANPLACAVSAASLDLLANGSWKQNVARIEAKLQEGLLPCSQLPGVKDARVLGAIGVLEMEQAVDVERLQRFFVQCGVWIRPFANLIYVMPPYLTEDTDIERLTSAMRDAVLEGLWR